LPRHQSLSIHEVKNGRRTTWPQGPSGRQETSGEIPQSHRTLTEGRHIVLNYVPAATGLHIRGDPVQLQEVILNLITNAMDAISEAEAKRSARSA
jgi:signal transduction histidine kinase